MAALPETLKPFDGIIRLMQTTPPTPTKDTSDEIDLLALLGALIDNKLTIAACTGVFAVCGIAYALLATPIYRADAVVQIEEKSQGIGSLLGDAAGGDMFSAPSAATTEIELLKSRKVIGQAVDNLKLDIDAGGVQSRRMIERAIKKEQSASQSNQA